MIEDVFKFHILSYLLRTPQEVKEVFDSEPSNGRASCPSCGSRRTEPYPDCPCRSIYGYHANKYHHTCCKEDKK